MIYTMKIQLLTDSNQHQQLSDAAKVFCEVCNYISEVGYLTRTCRNKVKLSKQCYHTVRERFNLPSQLVVRAVGKVVQAYKTGVSSMVKFGETTSVVYDTRLLKFNWMQSVSIATLNGRIDIPFKVSGYRRGAYDHRVHGLADLIEEDGTFYILLVVDLPEEPSITTLSFSEVTL